MIRRPHFFVIQVYCARVCLLVNNDIGLSSSLFVAAEPQTIPVELRTCDYCGTNDSPIGSVKWYHCGSTQKLAHAQYWKYDINILLLHSKYLIIDMVNWLNQRAIYQSICHATVSIFGVSWFQDFRGFLHEDIACTSCYCHWPQS